jgi:hypothetical protein
MNNMKTHIMFIGGSKEELDIFLDALRNVPEEDGFKCTYAATASQASEMLKFLVPDFILVSQEISNNQELLSMISKRPKLEGIKLFLYCNNNSMQVTGTGFAGYIERNQSVPNLSDNLTSILASHTNTYTFSGK